MKQQEATDFVIRGLDQGRTCDEIVRTLCERTSWPAKQVELFVQRVQARHRQSAVGLVASPSPAQTQRRVEVEPSERAAQPAIPQPAQPYPQHIEPEQYPEVVQAVVDALGKHQSRKLIVRSLCEQHGWPWRQAHHFVQRIEVEHHGQIATRQSPLLIALGLGILIIGALDLIYVTYLSLGGHSISVYGVPYAGNLGGFVTGIGMVLGGIAGIWRTISMARE